MQSHTEFEILTSKNIGDMHQTQCRFKKLGQRSRSQRSKDGTPHFNIPNCMLTSNLGFLPQIIWDLLWARIFLKLGRRSRSQWPKLHCHIKFGIPTSNKMRYALGTKILETRSEVKVTATKVACSHQFKEVESYKNLGVILSNDCSWQNYIDYIKEKAWTRINIMRRLKYDLDRKSL